MNNHTVKIKICGLRDPLNIDGICSLKPDYIGLIFYPKSKRYVKDITDGKALSFIPRNIIRTGVFVNEHVETVESCIADFSLNALQLHGNEPPEYCQYFKSKNITTIKAFHMDENFNFADLSGYQDHCDYFLFDTKTPGYGGSGTKFDWEMLNKYTLNTPFFISGGIDINDAQILKNIKHPSFYAVDINSKFEKEAGMKDIDKIRRFMQLLYA